MDKGKAKVDTKDEVVEVTEDEVVEVTEDEVIELEENNEVTKFFYNIKNPVPAVIFTTSGK